MSEPVQVELFDPPLCCPIGLCGPTLDQTLLDVNEMLLTLQAQGIRAALAPEAAYGAGPSKCD